MSSQKFSFDRFSSLSFLGRIQFIRELKAHLDQAVAFRKENGLEDCTSLTAWEKECNNVLDLYKARLNKWEGEPQLDLTLEQFIDLFKESEKRWSAVRVINSNMLILPFQAFLPELLNSTDDANSKILFSLSEHINLAQLWGKVPNDLFCNALHIKAFGRTANNPMKPMNIRTDYFRTTKYIDLFGANFSQKDFVSVIETITNENLNEKVQEQLLILIFALLVRDDYTLLKSLKDEHAPTLASVLNQVETLKENYYYGGIEFYANSWGNKMEIVLNRAKELILSEELLEKIAFEKLTQSFLDNETRFFSEKIKSFIYWSKGLSENNQLKAVDFIFEKTFEEVENLKNSRHISDAIEGVLNLISLATADGLPKRVERKTLNTLYRKTAEVFEQIYSPLLDKIFSETKIEFIHAPGVEEIYSRKASSIRCFIESINNLRNIAEILNKKLSDNIVEFEKTALTLIDTAKQIDKAQELAEEELARNKLKEAEKERKKKQKQFADFKKQLLADVDIW